MAVDESPWQPLKGAAERIWRSLEASVWLQLTVLRHLPIKGAVTPPYSCYGVCRCSFMHNSPKVWPQHCNQGFGSLQQLDSCFYFALFFPSVLLWISCDHGPVKQHLAAACPLNSLYLAYLKKKYIFMSVEPLFLVHSNYIFRCRSLERTQLLLRIGQGRDPHNSSLQNWAIYSKMIYLNTNLSKPEDKHLFLNLRWTVPLSKNSITILNSYCVSRGTKWSFMQNQPGAFMLHQIQMRPL